MSKPRRGLGENPLDDLIGAQLRPPSPPSAEPGRGREGGEATDAIAPKGGKRWKRVMVYLDPETDGRWLNEIVGRARAEGLTQREMGDTEIIRAGLAELQRLSWGQLVERVTTRPRRSN